jgi:mRNA-degrading endonuclease RelE of RelBE toxin-antitoxin system
MAVTYELYLEPAVHQARKELPGKVRQRVRRHLEALAGRPRPRDSRRLKTSSIQLAPGVEVRRIRIDRWRIVYAVNDAECWVWVLGIYRRPPYDYEDLAGLADRLPRT